MIKAKNMGFTLVELIITIAIISILTAVLAPSYVKYVEQSRETVCAGNRAQLTRACYVENCERGRGLTADEIRTIQDQYASDICPNHGNITVTKSDEFEYTAACDVHADSPVQFTPGEMVSKNFETLNPDDYAHSKNDKLFQQYFDTYGWESMMVNGETYYAKPYYNESTGTVTIFANKLSGADKNWSANLIYHDGVWYQYVNPYGYNGSMSVANQTWESIVQSVEQQNAKLVPIS